MKYKYKRNGEKRNCIVCGKEFISTLWNIKKGGGKYCSHKCQCTGKNNPFWNGGKTTHQRGYILVRKPNHPLSNSRGYVAEHRLVMEKHLGRYLDKDEVVHHINKNVKDNRIENLQLFKNHGTHLKYEWVIGSFYGRI